MCVTQPNGFEEKSELERASFFLPYIISLVIYLIQLPEFLENMKTKKFVLVHGEGFGAWCWYKSIALLEESGLLPIALDLEGSGINQTDTNNVTTLAEYSKPLIDFLHTLSEEEKVKIYLFPQYRFYCHL